MIENKPFMTVVLEFPCAYPGEPDYFKGTLATRSVIICNELSRA